MSRVIITDNIGGEHRSGVLPAADGPHAAAARGGRAASRRVIGQSDGRILRWAMLYWIIYRQISCKNWIQFNFQIFQMTMSTNNSTVVVQSGSKSQLLDFDYFIFYVSNAIQWTRNNVPYVSYCYSRVNRNITSLIITKKEQDLSQPCKVHLERREAGLLYWLPATDLNERRPVGCRALRILRGSMLHKIVRKSRVENCYFND